MAVCRSVSSKLYMWRSSCFDFHSVLLMLIYYSWVLWVWLNRGSFRVSRAEIWRLLIMHDNPHMELCKWEQRGNEIFQCTGMQESQKHTSAVSHMVMYNLCFYLQWTVNSIHQQIRKYHSYDFLWESRLRSGNDQHTNIKYMIADCFFFFSRHVHR